MFSAVVAFLSCGCDRAPAPAGVQRASSGFVLVQQLGSRVTDMIDMQGALVHRWQSSAGLAGGARMLPNGDLLRAVKADRSPFPMSAPGMTGLVERLDWDGRRVWSFVHAGERHVLHHDVEVLPNGNLLLIGLEVKNRDELLAAGRNRARLGAGTLWCDYLIEVAPEGESGGRIVWQWKVWDHLVQDYDARGGNFGDVAAHPELIDLNFIETPAPPDAPRPPLPDWTHVNSVAYDAGRDLILLAVRNFDEVWVIDHSTSMQEAAGHAGGRHGRGGDVLWRWGNPHACLRGRPSDQKLFGPGGAQWIPPGLPGAGNVLIFNGGEGRKDGAYSTVEELQLPLTADGVFRPAGDGAFGPDAPVWRYVAEPKTALHSPFLSGAQRLASGGTFICSGIQRRIFEVDPAGRIVWSHEVSSDGDPAPEEPTPPPGPMGGPPGFPGAPGATLPVPPLITILDSNDDGSLDAAELANAPGRLASLDKDADGFASLEECLPAPGGPPGGAPGVPPGGASGRPPLPPIFSALDRNGDSRLDDGEIARAPASLLTLDLDRDAKISIAECLPASARGNPGDPLGANDPGDPLGAGVPPGPPGMPGAPGGPGFPPQMPPLITIADANGDGGIDAAEMAGAPALLKTLDRDGNGFLSIEECFPMPGGPGGPGGPPGAFPGSPPGGAGGPPAGAPGRPPLPPIFTALDGNGDGKIDGAEIAQASAGLKKLDRDGDGKVSLKERLPGAPAGPEGALRGSLIRATYFPADDPILKARASSVPAGAKAQPAPER